MTSSSTRSTLAEELVLANGARLDSLAPLPHGRSHLVFTAVDQDTGQRLVVKIDERGTGRLDQEYAVLDFLRATQAPAPQPVALTRVSETGMRCLLMQYRPGQPPQEPAGYRRWGADLSVLARSCNVNNWLPVTTAADLDAEHQARVQRLAPQLGAIAGAVRAVRAPRTPLVFTHGDPAPDNYLDAPDAGTLLDFEAARLAPSGLDLARATVALHLAHPGPDRRAAISALVAGYRERIDPPQSKHWRSWLAIAGLQLVAWRVAAADRPGTPPWQPAVDALGTLLREPPPC